MGRDRGAGPAIRSDEELDGASQETIDAIHELLSSRRRRFVLFYLFEEGRAQLTTLSQRIAASEHDREPDELPVDIRQQTYLDLYHTHVPKLTEHGIVEYCDEEGAVKLAEPDDTLRTCLAASLGTDLDSAETVWR